MTTRSDPAELGRIASWVSDRVSDPEIVELARRLEVAFAEIRDKQPRSSLEDMPGRYERWVDSGDERVDDVLEGLIADLVDLADGRVMKPWLVAENKLRLAYARMDE